jgi:hypothetical protein
VFVALTADCIREYMAELGKHLSEDDIEVKAYTSSSSALEKTNPGTEKLLQTQNNKYIQFSCDINAL